MLMLTKIVVRWFNLLWNWCRLFSWQLAGTNI